MAFTPPVTFAPTQQGFAANLNETVTALAEYARAVEQDDEGETLPVLKVTPSTSGAAPFEIRMQSYPNTGSGAGTHNRGVWFGWNSAVFAGGTVTTGKPSLHMGFEDNYFDDGGDGTYGVEWYVGYTTPDNSTIGIADLRPFYFRVKDSDVNSASKSVLTTLDIGAGASGSLTVAGGLGTSLFTVQQSAVTTYKNTVVAPVTGAAQLQIKAPGTGASGNNASIYFQIAAANKWRITSDEFSEIFLYDEINNRFHAVFNAGASNTAAVTDLRSSLKVNGNVGFYGTTPQAKPTGVAITAAGIHAALVTLGLIAA